MDEQNAALRELQLQNKKLQRENRRLVTECELLSNQNEQVSRTQKFFHRENQRQLFYNQQLLKTSPYILMMVNEKLETVMASDLFFQKTDVSRDAVKDGMKLSEAFSGVLQEDALQFLLERCESVLLSHGTDSFLITTREEGKGKDRFYQADICYYMEENEDAKGLSIILSDMTEIVEAKERAENADKAKSSFLAQMSHEIRTPINTVLGMNEMILREAAEPSVLDYARNIRNAGRTLLSLINSILDFSKIEEGKMEIIPVEYDTASVMNNLVLSIAERARQKGLELRVELDPQLPSRMIGDDIRLSQILMNLLTNAVKYTERGFVRFCVSGRRIEDEPRTDGDCAEISLQFSVEDTGIGIRREDIPRLCESFERLDVVRNHNIEGTGLGMSIVKGLLDLMNSRLQVESVYGQGSVFSFEITQKIADDTPIGSYSWKPDVARDPAERETLRAAHGRILVVDDNEMNLKVARSLLGLFDIRPDLAGSGQEAVGLLRAGKTYHVIFLDHMMPKMDGIETLKHIKEEKLLTRGTTVIALTANAVNGARERYLAAGFDDYLSKPIEVAKLENLLLHYLPEEICSRREDETEETVSDDTDLSGTDPAPASDDEVLSKLSAAGIDTESGILYAAEDREFYLELVSAFAEEYASNASAIRTSWEQGDWANYKICVHSLKSSARMIGANELADLALVQETAAKEQDEAIIQAGAEELLRKYEELYRLIRV